jgi:hypothetical protein
MCVYISGYNPGTFKGEKIASAKQALDFDRGKNGIVFFRYLARKGTR